MKRDDSYSREKYQIDDRMEEFPEKWEPGVRLKRPLYGNRMVAAGKLVP